jgi:anti-sigma-K factor RskA
MNDPHSLAAAYALHALDESEEREFEQHLAGCDRCRQELVGLREAAAALAYAPEGPTPPPGLRQRILEQARAERPNVVPLKPRRTRTWAIPAAAAAVAACAAIGLGIWAATLSSRLDHERSARRAESKALALLAESGAQRVPLVGAKGALLVGADRRGALVVSRLKPAPSTKTYEAWVATSGRTTPAGLFRGGQNTIVLLEKRVPPGSSVAVTVERKGGVRQPTSRPILQTEPSA